MPLVMTSGPALEPVSLAEAKALARVDGQAEDPLIQSLIITSRLHVEAALGLALISQSWRLSLDRWPRGNAVELPIRPVQSIGAVRVGDGSGDLLTVDPALYELDRDSVVPRLINRGETWFLPRAATNAIEIEFDAGFGAAASAVPQSIRHALLLLVVHWYEHRDPIEIGSSSTRIPDAVSVLLDPYKVKRL